MKRPRPILVVAIIIAVIFCVPVFFAAQFFASVVVYRLMELAGIAGMSPTGATAVKILGQFLVMLIAMGMTYGTFTGLRWVWRGTNFAKR